MIEVKNVEKSFDEEGGKRQVLFGINAKFYDGKTNLIIGQSGSGKTVLVKNLVGFSMTAETSLRWKTSR